MTPLFELTEAYHAARKDPEFQQQLDHHLREFAGRPTNLYFAERLTEHCGGAKIYLKREDLLHTGAHKINNALGQALIAKRMGKTRIIAETGAGSTVSRPPRCVRRWASNVSSTWVRKTCAAKRSTSFACACVVPRCGAFCRTEDTQGSRQRSHA